MAFNGLMTLLICGSMCLLPMAILLPVWAVLVYTPSRWNKRSEALATALGYRRAVRQRRAWWYEKEAINGRSVAFYPLYLPGITYHGVDAVSARATGKAGMRLLVEIMAPGPTAVSLYSNLAKGEEVTTFTETFIGENHAQVPTRVQQALLAFQRQHGQKLRLYDRQSIKPAMMPAQILPQATLVLMHDFYVPKELETAVPNLMDDLISIAELWEKELMYG